MNFNKWLDTFVSEKEIDMNTEFTVEHNGDIHFVSIDSVIELCKKTSKEQQKTIKDALVYLDFRNADVIDYFNHLAKAYIYTNF